MSWARRCIKWEVPLFVVLALATTAMAAFFLIAEDVWERQAMPLDTLILNFLFGIRSPALTVLANVITAGGSVQFVAVAVVLAWLRCPFTGSWVTWPAVTFALLCAT